MSGQLSAGHFGSACRVELNQRASNMRAGMFVIKLYVLDQVSLGIHKADLTSALKTYHLLSERWFTHASPTLFNAGTPRPQLSSCFLICSKKDSIEVHPVFQPLPPCNHIAILDQQGWQQPGHNVALFRPKRTVLLHPLKSLTRSEQVAHNDA